MKGVFLGPIASGYRDLLVPKLAVAVDLISCPDVDDRAGLANALADADVVLSQSWTRDYPPAPRLKLLQATGAGYEQIDLAAVPPQATVSNAYGHENAIGEYIVLALLAWCHKFVDAHIAFRAGSWEHSGHRGAAFHGELGGKTVGILGLGRIGRAAASRVKPFGTRVLACNRTMVPATDGVDLVYPLAELPAFLAACDFVVVCTALTDETRGFFGTAQFAAMKPGAVVINVGRGPVIDEDALWAACTGGRIGGAIIDAWYRYPSAEDPAPRPSRHAFHDLPNVLMTPHSSGWTTGMIDRRLDEIADNLARLARGAPLINVIRPPR